MRGRKIISAFLIASVMLSLFLIFQEGTEAQTVDYIILTDAPNGTALTTVVLNPGEQVTAYASGYNITTGFVGLVEVEWSGAVGNWSPGTGTNSTFTAGGTPGLYTQTGQNTTMGVSDIFDVEIVVLTVDYIIVRDASGGGGDWVGPRFYTLWDSDIFYAAGYNKTYGYVDNVFV